MAQRYRLKLNRLDFVSPVDQPAQETAKVLLLKRRAQVDSFARVVKTSDDLGLVFCWAFTSTDGSGQPYHDLQGDAIDQDFIKAAADFMLDGGRTDEMHDSQPDGRVVFAMPMTPEIAKAFGVVTKTTGLMVALKPSTEVYAKFKSGEYTGVSIAGMGARELVKRRIAKQAVMTDETDGHQHVLDLDDPATSWCSMYSTSYQTAAGAENGHSHSWTFSSDGTITIGADSDHTHTLPAGTVVPPDVLAAYAALDAAQDVENAETAATPTVVLAETSDGICAPVTDEESSGKVINVVIAARAPANKSTHPNTKREGSPMANETDIKTADLTKRLERAERIVKMSGAHKAHFDTLTGESADAFLAKSVTERDVVVAEIAKRAEEADKVVYVSKSTGDVYKAKDDARLVEMAKRMDAQATEIKKAAIRKTASQLLGTKAPGDDETHDFIVEQLGGNEKAMECLKGLVASSKIGKTAPGFSGGDSAGGAEGDGSEEAALAALEKGLVTFCKAQNIPVDKAWNTGLPAFTQTDEGKALKLAYDESIAG